MRKNGIYYFYNIPLSKTPGPHFHNRGASCKGRYYGLHHIKTQEISGGGWAHLAIQALMATGIEVVAEIKNTEENNDPLCVRLLTP